MGTFTKPDYQELLQRARTPREKEVIQAIIDTGSQKSAALELNLHIRSVEKKVAKVKKYPIITHKINTPRINPDTKIDTDTDTDTNNYRDNEATEITALNPENGTLMTKEEFCEVYGIDIETIHSAKLVTHTGIPYWNIAFKDPKQDIITDNWEEIMEHLRECIGSFRMMPFSAPVSRKKEAVLTLSDLHLGAYVDGLIKTQEFSIAKVVERLSLTRDHINSFGYSKVHVHILGDLIESFTGLNHKNTWKNLGKGMFGAEVVKLTVNILNEFLSSVANLGSIKIVGGNHDRLTSDKTEDSGGGAADLIGWGLGLIGYDVEFNPIIVTHKVDGINYVLTHGHHVLSKKSTKEIIWDYGQQGMFNFVMEGHLHSRIQKLTTSTAKNFKTLKDDSVDCRRQICPSIFTGNSYSEELGYTTTAGFLITENNGNGIPNVFDFAV